MPGLPGKGGKSEAIVMLFEGEDSASKRACRTAESLVLRVEVVILVTLGHCHNWCSVGCWLDAGFESNEIVLRWIYNIIEMDGE